MCSTGENLNATSVFQDMCTDDATDVCLWRYTHLLEAYVSRLRRGTHKGGYKVLKRPHADINPQKATIVSLFSDRAVISYPPCPDEESQKATWFLAIRYEVAHELGHIALEETINSLPTDKRGRYTNDWKEAEAWNFAKELMLDRTDFYKRRLENPLNLCVPSDAIDREIEKRRKKTDENKAKSS